MPGASVYAAGKAALNSLATLADVELAAKKIRVNEFGPVATIMTLRASTVSALPEQLVP